MPVLNGVQVASLLRDSGSGVKLILLTVHEDPDYIEAAFSVGELQAMSSNLALSPI